MIMLKCNNLGCRVSQKLTALRTGISWLVTPGSAKHRTILQRQTASSACSKSATMSSPCSIPIDKRTMSSVTPALSSS